MRAATDVAAVGTVARLGRPSRSRWNPPYFVSGIQLLQPGYPLSFVAERAKEPPRQPDLAGRFEGWVYKRKAQAKASALPSARLSLAGLFRCQDHHHLPAFHRGLNLDLGIIASLGPDPLQKLIANILMRHFTAAET